MPRDARPWLLAGVLTLAGPAPAAATPVLGVGAAPCADFVEVVEGDFRSPIGALNFHGYLSWTHGYLTAKAAAGMLDLAGLDREVLKLDLAAYCREHPDKLLRDAADHYAGRQRPER